MFLNCVLIVSYLSVYVHQCHHVCLLLMAAAEQRGRPSRDNSVSPPPTAVQTQQPQSTNAQVTDVSLEQQVETVSSDSPPGDDTGMCETLSIHLLREIYHPRHLPLGYGLDF